jgi:hypothetical protein
LNAGEPLLNSADRLVGYWSARQACKRSMNRLSARLMRWSRFHSR